MVAMIVVNAQVAGKKKNGDFEQILWTIERELFRKVISWPFSPPLLSFLPIQDVRRRPIGYPVRTNLSPRLICVEWPP
jgi:hypothetical protein